MKVLHSLETFLPDGCGGTEIYTQSLITSLAGFELAHEVIAPIVATQGCDYPYDGFKVWRYPVTQADQGLLQGSSAPEGFDDFKQLLAAQDADIYHQHAWQQSCGLWHLKAAKQRGMKTILTVHVPGISCICGTRVDDKGLQCYRPMNISACGECCLHNRRLPVWLTEPVTKLPESLNQVLQMIPFPAPVSRLLVQQQQIEKHIEDIAAMCVYADQIVAVCQWIYNALIACDVPAEKLQLCRQGVAPRLLSQLEILPKKPTNEAFTLGFIGRCDSLKGIDVLLKAVQAQPAYINIKLIIHALDLDPKKPEDLSEYCQDIYSRCQNDPRIVLKSPIPHKQLAQALQQFDMLAVPSQWLETGPLVVLEAFAAGVPVLGSDLGGIAELVQHNQNGFLVPAADAKAWQQAIYEFARYPKQHQHLAQGIGKVRTMYDVAEDMWQLYQTLV